MARVLTILADELARRTVGDHLRLAGQVVSAASRAEEGLALARSDRPELIVIDGTLPDARGVDVCIALKQEPLTRGASVMIVSESAREIDRIVALELGAEDYVLKPFNLRELVLRVLAILRRRGVADRGSAAAEETIGALKIDRHAYRVWSNGAEVSLSTLEFHVLLAIFDVRPHVRGRDALLRSLWGVEGASDSRALDTSIRRLRRKLGVAAACIETVRGVGYRFRAH